jgi:Na+(H+)/acetate symporter ActP
LVYALAQDAPHNSCPATALRQAVVSGTQPAIYVLLLIALTAANLPFLLERKFFVFKPGAARKAFGWRLLELTLLYFVVGALALGIESRQGQIYQQQWEFYAITYFLFLVFAYPGFVYRYMWRRT